MKRAIYIILAIFLIAETSCITDQDKVKKTDLFEEFEAEEGFVILHIPPVLFKIMLSASDDNEFNSKELLNKIEVVKVMFFEQKNNSLKKDDIANSMNKKIGDFDYNLLTRIAQENNDISIYIIEREKIIYEVLITVVSENEYIGLNLVGKFTKDEVLKVYQSINMQKLRSLDN